MANSYLYKNQGTATNAKKFTYSVWIKRSELGSVNRFYQGWESSNNRFYAYFNTTNTLFVYAVTGGSIQVNWESARKFRDTNGWYHIVFSADSTQANTADRLKIYVNGVEETEFTKNNNPTQNIDWGNQITQSSGDLTISGTEIQTQLFEGYMSHAAYVDGSQLLPTSFGEFDSTSGIWKIITAPSVTWGNTGYHLKFENSANLGLDSSENTNNFTVGGNLKQGLTNPSNIYQSLNPSSTDSGVTLTNGNTTSDFDGSVGNAKGQLAVTKGKWYYECKITASSNYPMLGIGDINRNQMEKRTGGSYPGGFQDSYGVYGNGNVYANGSNTGSQSFTYATNDIISIIIDLDSGTKTIKWNKNGTQIATTNITNAGDDFAYAPMDYNGGESGVTCNYNFGEGRFGTTDISSAGSNGNGSLFEYDVPSGHYAMNTKNINTYG